MPPPYKTQPAARVFGFSYPSDARGSDPVDHAGARLLDGIAVAAVMTIVIGSVIVRWFTTLNHDTAYFLAQAKMLSQGRHLYSDLIDKDTPVSTLIGRGSVALAAMTGLPLDRAHVVVLSAFLSLSVGVGCVLVRRFAAPHRSRFLAFAVASSLAAFILPATDFGQREHLFAAAVCPYFIAVAMHWRGVARRRIEVAAVGALAIVGFFVKPHFVAFAAAIWIAEFLGARGSLRRVSAETRLTALGTVGAYGTFLLLEPSYLTLIVPSQAATYLEYRGTFLSALSAHLTILVLVGLSLVLSSVFVWDESRRHLRTLVLRLGWPIYLAGLVVVGVQGFGFTYHVLPLFMWGFLLCAMISVHIVAFVFERQRARSSLWVRAMAVASLACALATSLQFLESAVRRQYAFTTGSPRSDTINHPFVKALSLNGPSHYVYIFCGSVIPGGLAFVYANTRWSGHTIAMSLLPILYDYRVDPTLYPRTDPGVLARIETAERHLIARDFVERTPDLVLFDFGETKRFFKTGGFDYLAFLNEDKTFRDLWQKYRYSEVGDLQDFRGRPFRVFVRNESSIDRFELSRVMGSW